MRGGYLPPNTTSGTAAFMDALCHSKRLKPELSHNGQERKKIANRPELEEVEEGEERTG
jgi:hypothetical protein